MIDEYNEPSTSQSRFSFSDVSDTTVNSSFVKSIVAKNPVGNTNNFSVENYVKGTDGGATQNNFKINGSSGIRVGDAYYNIFYSKSTQDGKSLNKSRNDTEENFTNSSKRKFNIWKPRKSYVIICVSVLLVATITGVFLYFLLPSNESNGGPWDSTTPEITTSQSKNYTTVGTTSTLSSYSTATSTLSSYSTTTSEFPISPDLIIPRSEWTNDSLNENIKLLTSDPIQRIIIGQTDDTESCFTRDDCITKIQEIRARNLELLDIPWNFLVGGDGRVYEGRGYRHEGEHTLNVNASNYNDIGIGIGFIGNFISEEPSSEMINALSNFLTRSMRTGNLVIDYKVFLQNQLTFKSIKEVGLKNALKWIFKEKFIEIQKINTRKDWGGINSCGEMSIMENPLERVILHHTATRNCSNEETCKYLMRVLQINAMGNNDIRICNFSDTHYNFLIGGVDDYAIVFEGRGFSYEGEHTKNYNDVSIGISLIGNFEVNRPGYAMMEALNIFINNAVTIGKLKQNYSLHFRSDIEDESSSPGYYVKKIVENWLNYSKP